MSKIIEDNTEKNIEEAIPPRDMLLFETIIKISALTKCLIKKQVITQEELDKEMIGLSQELVENIKKNVNSSSN